MGAVIPFRPFENAIRQALRMRVPANRNDCIQRVLGELKAGRNGNAVAARLQQERLASRACDKGGDCA